MTQIEQSTARQSELKEIVAIAEGAEAKMKLFAHQAEKFIDKLEQAVSQHDR